MTPDRSVVLVLQPGPSRCDRYLPPTGPRFENLGYPLVATSYLKVQYLQRRRLLRPRGEVLDHH